MLLRIADSLWSSGGGDVVSKSLEGGKHRTIPIFVHNIVWNPPNYSHNWLKMTLCSALLITRCRHGAVEVEMSFIKVPGAGNIAHLKILRTPLVTCAKFLCIVIKITIYSVLHKPFLLL